MKAKLKSLHSPDVDLESFAPENPTNFGFLLQAMIGPDGIEGAESFDIQVCTPKWLLDKHAEGVFPDVVFGAQMMLVFLFDLRQITGALERYCSRCLGNDWGELATSLSKIGAWEFEGYNNKRQP